MRSAEWHSDGVESTLVLRALTVEEVPVFHGVEWLVQCQEWLGSKGLFLTTFEEDPYKEEPRLQQSVTFIASGPGPRGHRHSVLWRNGKLLHDPHPSGEGLVGYPEEFEVLVVTDMDLLRSVK